MELNNKTREELKSIGFNHINDGWYSNNDDTIIIRMWVNDEIIKVIEKLSKQREESIIIFQKGGRNDLVESEQFELNILKEYLPTKKSIDETIIIVQELINNGINNIGGIMKEISKYGNLINKKIVGDIFKELC